MRVSITNPVDSKTLLHIFFDGNDPRKDLIDAVELVNQYADEYIRATGHKIQ